MLLASSSGERQKALVRCSKSISSELNDYTAPEPDLSVLRFRDNYYTESATSDDVLLLIEAGRH